MNQRKCTLAAILILLTTLTLLSSCSQQPERTPYQSRTAYRAPSGRAFDAVSGMQTASGSQLSCQIRSGRHTPYAIATCAPGELATGGGCWTDSPSAPILANCPSNGGTGCNPSSVPVAWFCSVSASGVTAYVNCCK